MLIKWSEVKIMIRPGKTDFRKQINGLTEIVKSEMKLNPLSKYIFIFCSADRKKIKILYWDKTGFCLWLKRLETNKFPWPKSHDETYSITFKELRMLLAGINFFSKHKMSEFSKF